MNHLIKNTALILTLIIVELTSQNVYSQDISKRLAHLSTNGTVIMNISYSDLKKCIIMSTHIGHEILSIDEVNIISLTDSSGLYSYWLAFAGLSNNGGYIEAIELKEENGNIYPLAPNAEKMKHSCSGVKCSSCELKSDLFGSKYCKCARPVESNGYCNHTVSELGTNNIVLGEDIGDMFYYSTFYDMLP